MISYKLFIVFIKDKNSVMSIPSWIQGLKLLYWCDMAAWWVESIVWLEQICKQDFNLRIIRNTSLESKKKKLAAKCLCNNIAS